MWWKSRRRIEPSLQPFAFPGIPRRYDQGDRVGAYVAVCRAGGKMFAYNLNPNLSFWRKLWAVAHGPKHYWQLRKIKREAERKD
jgi:hypothetical protein